MENSKDQSEAAKAPAKAQMCSTSELFQFLNGKDRCLMYIGTFASLLAGLAMP